MSRFKHRLQLIQSAFQIVWQKYNLEIVKGGKGRRKKFPFTVNGSKNLSPSSGISTIFWNIKISFRSKQDSFLY